MSPEASDWWARAVRALQAAERDLASNDPDAATSRAYYAAFYAVSALFTHEDEDRSFRKHAAVRDAVHRELVRTGRWSTELGRSYDKLLEARLVGDYGGAEHVTQEQARKALAAAREILSAVRREIPEELPG